MGKLIVLEGIDGSGKSTQFKRLCEQMRAEDREFLSVSFPQYNEPSSALIKMYLGGEFGDDPKAVNAYAASTFFAVDRFASYVKHWHSYYESGGLILLDRYTTSNAIHQGAKLDENSRTKFFDWLYEFEFGLLELPRPDLVIYMDITAARALERLQDRSEKTGTASDIHERDVRFLEAGVTAGRHAANYCGWKVIRCEECGAERDADSIHKEVMRCVSSAAF